MESDWMTMPRLLYLLIPLLVLELALVVYCLVDLSHREQTRGPKWLWVVIILLGSLWGPVLYLLVGKKE